MNTVINYKHFPCQWTDLAFFSGCSLFYYVDSHILVSAPFVINTKSSLS